MRNRNDGWYVVSVMALGGNQGWKPCFDWCVDYFNHIMDDWSYMGEGVFEFRNEKDYMWFLLRWQ